VSLGALRLQNMHTNTLLYGLILLASCNARCVWRKRARVAAGSSAASYGSGGGCQSGWRQAVDDSAPAPQHCISVLRSRRPFHANGNKQPGFCVSECLVLQQHSLNMIEPAGLMDYTCSIVWRSSELLPPASMLAKLTSNEARLCTMVDDRS
jgi:hypothetical protein